MMECYPANRPKLLRYVFVGVLLLALFLPSSAVHAIDLRWEPTAPEGGESLVVPFKGGPQAVTTGSAYSGVVTLTVTGIGQASGTSFGDAFYLLTDYGGNLVPPYHPTWHYDFVLWINGQHPEDLIVGQQVPAYRGDHSYTFDINAPGGKLTFGVGDVYTIDNTGSFSVSVAGATSSCSVPFFSQRDARWADHALRSAGVCSAYCSKIGTCGCTLTSATMLFAYYGAASTPPQLSDCLVTQACPFDWETAASCSAGEAEFVARSDFNDGSGWQRLDRELNQNHRPVLLGMHRTGDVNKAHWVLVISGHGADPGTYLVNDPWPLDGANTNLSVLSSNGWVPDTLSAYSGMAACTQVAGTRGETREPAATGVSDSADVVTGNVWLWHANETSLVVKVSASSSAGGVTQMQVWTDSHPAWGWEAFSEFTWVRWQPGDRIHAIFRDELGNVSSETGDTLYPESTPSNVAGDYYEILLPIIVR